MSNSHSPYSPFNSLFLGVNQNFWACFHPVNEWKLLWSFTLLQGESKLKNFISPFKKGELKIEYGESPFNSTWINMNHPHSCLKESPFQGWISVRQLHLSQKFQTRLNFSFRDENNRIEIEFKIIYWKLKIKHRFFIFIFEAYSISKFANNQTVFFFAIFFLYRNKFFFSKFYFQFRNKIFFFVYNPRYNLTSLANYLKFFYLK